MIGMIPFKLTIKECHKMTALIILIALIAIIADELNTHKKQRENRVAAQKRIYEFNSYMKKLKNIQEKDYTKDL